MDEKHIIKSGKLKPGEVFRIEAKMSDLPGIKPAITVSTQFILPLSCLPRPAICRN